MSCLRLIAAVTLFTVALGGSVKAADDRAKSPASPAQTAVTADSSSGMGVVDRVVASVNQEPVLASDVEDAARIEALIEGKPAAEVTPADLKAAMERLIDRTLIRQQMPSIPAALDQPVRSRTAEIRALLPGAQSDTAWKTTLASYGIDEQKLKKYLEDQFQLLQFVDARLRPNADVSWNEIQSYYNDKLLPELKQLGAAPEPLHNVQGRIREILLQQKIDAQLNSWLASLREQGRVRILQSPMEASRGSGFSGRGMSFSILDRQ